MRICQVTRICQLEGPCQLEFFKIIIFNFQAICTQEYMHARAHTIARSPSLLHSPSCFSNFAQHLSKLVPSLIWVGSITLNMVLQELNVCFQVSSLPKRKGPIERCENTLPCMGVGSNIGNCLPVVVYHCGH